MRYRQATNRKLTLLQGRYSWCTSAYSSSSLCDDRYSTWWSTNTFPSIWGKQSFPVIRSYLNKQDVKFPGHKTNTFRWNRYSGNILKGIVNARIPEIGTPRALGLHSHKFTKSDYRSIVLAREVLLRLYIVPSNPWLEIQYRYLKIQILENYIVSSWILHFPDLHY